MFSAIRARLRLDSVGARLTFWYLLTLGATLVAFAVFVYVVRARTLYHELDAELEVGTHRLVSELRPALLGLNPQTVPAEVDERASFVVRDSPGHVIFRSAAFPRVDWAEDRRLSLAARDRTRFVSVSGADGVSTRVVTLQVDRPGTEPLFIQAAASTAGVRLVLSQLASAMAIAIGLVLAVASYGSRGTTRRALAPVEAIVQRVRQIQASHLSVRLDVDARSAELDGLVRTLNEMLDRIEGSVRATRRFAADASHELQTPLAAMRSGLELCISAPRTPEEYQDMAADLFAEIDRLSRLIRDLRLLALADAGHLIPTPERVDVREIVDECCDVARAIAEEKDIRIAVDIQDTPVVIGSPVHLRRAIINLVSNAVRYSPPLSLVSLAVRCVNGEVVVSVQDEGCGIAPDDVAHIFEAFYRADPARARDTGGTGLGLAIVDQVVRAHSGRVDVVTTPGQGSTFSLVLPAAPAASLPSRTSSSTSFPCAHSMT